MSDLSSFTGKFRAQRLTGNESSSTRVIKRPRPSLVCNQCRKNKLRCDRGQPCGGCVKRDEADICNYQRPPGPPNDVSRQVVAEDRLMHLELTVKQLMQNHALAQSEQDPNSKETLLPPPESSHNIVDALDGPQIEKNGTTRYVGSTHWSAVLDDIHELRAVLDDSGDALEEEDPSPYERNEFESELMFGASSAYPVHKIIAQFLPPKVEVDRFVSIYFRGETFVVPFLHAYQFQRQYGEFWADTTNVNPLWLCQLFCICYMASYVGQSTGLSNSSRNEFGDSQSIFHVAAGQCLVAGRYHSPQQFAPEALGMYSQCKNLKSLDPSREAGTVLGIAVRIAYQMGYHRDPDALGSFTAFEGEMRRRFWAAAKQMDLMISFQLGIPSNICLENCDAKSPRNLFDSDFDEDTQVLPASRPESEATPLLWFVVKDRQMIHFSKVCQNALSFKEMSEADIVQLDWEIRQMHATIPSVLKTRPLSESVADAPFIIVTRIYVDFIYLKSLCVLHRRYMAQGSIFSTNSCVEAAKKMVGQFIDMYREFAPGGQLYFERWMLTNFTLNDFLLGVMVLCLLLHIHWKKGARDFAIDDATEMEVRALLERSYTVCVEKSKESRDARRVSHAIRLTLNGARSSHAPEVTTGSQNPRTVITNSSTIESALGRTPGTGTTSLSSQSHHDHARGDEAAFGLLDPFNFMGNDLLNVDWSELDPEIFGTII